MNSDQVYADYNEAMAPFNDQAAVDNSIPPPEADDGTVYFGYDNGQGWANYDQINNEGWSAPADINSGGGYDGGYSGGGDYGGGYDGGGDGGGGGGDGGGDGGGGCD